jgi:hypothetical protein
MFERKSLVEDFEFKINKWLACVVNSSVEEALELTYEFPKKYLNIIL